MHLVYMLIENFMSMYIGQNPLTLLIINHYFVLMENRLHQMSNFCYCHYQVITLPYIHSSRDSEDLVNRLWIHGV
jgi:hypothetical protein